jgi:hypothetical protein
MSILTPDTDAAIQFLQRWAQQGPWVLTAHDPERNFIRTKAFGPGSLAACRGWISYWQTCESPRNIYFQVNLDRRPLDEIDKKSRKEHIAAVVALHADIDAYKDGEDLEAGRQRVLKMLTDDLPPGVPGPPSVINSSGNGYNCLWRLRQPIVIDGDVAKAVEIERYNRWLAVTYGGDMTTDVSRILRLPGTVNFPNERKRARGLVPVMSHTVELDTSRRYELVQFQAADPFRGASGAVAAEHIQIGSAIGIEDLDELDVPERTKIIIALGAYPDEERESRSEWLFSGICSMIACGVDNETILGVLTDPQWAISESVLEKPNPEDYARRQIVKAHARLSALAAKELIDD